MNKLTNKEAIFKQKLQGFEAPVNDALWAGIQSSLGTSSVGGVAGASKISAILLKSFAVAAFVGASAFGIYKMLSHNTNVLPKKSTQKISLNKNEEVLASTLETKRADASVALKKPVNNTNNQPKTKEIAKKPNPSEVHKSDLLLTNDINNSKSLTTIVKEEITENKSNNGFVQEINNKKDNTHKNDISQQTNNADKSLDVVTNNSIKKVEKSMDLDSSSVLFSSPNTTFLDKLPNVITPNGDGRNDVLLITTPKLQQYALTVYNENSEIIFRTNDPEVSWRGLDFNGQEVKAGIYIYQISAIGADGKDYGSKIQQVTVIR